MAGVRTGVPLFHDSIINQFPSGAMFAENAFMKKQSPYESR